MDIQRIRREIHQALQHFPNIETLTSVGGEIWIKAALQTSAGGVYVIAVTFADYPSQMPKVLVVAPKVQHTMHMYNSGHICYMHPNMWNPGRHDVMFVMAQAAVWLNKHEVYKAKGKWPGPGLKHN